MIHASLKAIAILMINNIQIECALISKNDNNVIDTVQKVHLYASQTNGHK